MYQKLFMILGTVLAIVLGFFFWNNRGDMDVSNFDDCVRAGNPIMESYPRQCRTPDGRNFVEDVDQPIGGQRDEWGCLGPAGYSYDEEVRACVREWELSLPQREAARIAVKYVGWESATTILNVQFVECPGCFIVELERGETRKRLNLNNYTVISMSIVS